MIDSINVTFYRTHYEKPLVLVHESPLSNREEECTPQKLRAIAATLLKIANDVEAQGNKRIKRSYLVGTE
jgi:hypothetical protein